MSNCANIHPDSPDELPPEEKAPTVAPFPIVGIGASAGDLGALSQFLSALPVDTGMAFVIARQAKANDQTDLDDDLLRATPMTVSEVVNGTPVEPNRVYVIPTDRDLRFAERTLYLAPRPEPSTPHFAIDTLFHSLATEQARLSIAVVLAGTGSDGSQGLKAIKSACGITFAQKDDAPPRPDIDRRAIETDAVDYVLSPVDIASELARLSRHCYLTAPPEVSAGEILPEGEEDLNHVFALLHRATDVDFSYYKRTSLLRRLGRRMLVHRIENLKDYVGYLKQHPGEVEALYRGLLINVTSFFRDPDAYAALADQISALVNQRKERTAFRAWIPGCSTGEEVYSLAIAVSEVLEEKGLPLRMQFIGTDLSEKALQVARYGRYAQSDLEHVSAHRRSRHFTEVDGSYQVSKLIRQSCIFARHDVTHDTPFSRLDLISCRNVLIYLEPALQKTVMSIFHFGLNPTGLLLLGSSESPGRANELFRVVDGTNRIFARKPGPSHLAGTFIPSGESQTPLAKVQVARSSSTSELRRRIDHAIQDRYLPACVVINENLRVVEFRGATGLYLQPPSGEASYDLLRMALGNLQYALRETTAQAIRENVLVEKSGIRVERMGTVFLIDLDVVPITGALHSERFFLVVFKQAAATAQSHSPGILPIDSGADFPTQLEVELQEVRQHLRAVSEDYAAALEAASATTEELQSANEELQSTNEEIETTKEELQSANEELTTVNEELDSRNHQLGTLNDDLTNLFSAVNVPILRVDREAILRRFTPAAATSFGIGPADLDHPIRRLQNRLPNQPDVDAVIQQVVADLAVQTQEMQDAEGRWWSLSVRPYRTAENNLDGAVLTFVDVDAIKNALQTSQEARHYADAIVETVREPIVILGPGLRLDRANSSFYTKFRLDAKRAQGMLLSELGGPPWPIPELTSRLQETLDQNRSFSDLEVKHTFPAIGPRRLLLNARQLQLGGLPRILLAIEDVTDRRRAEESITHRMEDTDRELDRTKEELRGLAARLMTAHEDEQRRIARELHDDIVQRLGFLGFQVEQFRMGPLAKAHGELANLLGSVQRQIAELSESARSISHGFHPAILDDLGLVAALRKLAGEFSRGRASPVRFRSRVAACTMPKAHFARGIYRIAQESLQNATKHAPDAKLTMSLSCKQGELTMTISDSGPGFDPTSVRGGGGLGIVNMQERARLLSATIRIDSKRGSGTTVTLRVPLLNSSDENFQSVAAN